MPDRSHPRSLRWYLLGVLAIAAIVLGRTVTHEFLDWDDTTLVVQNPLLNPVSAEHLKQVWTQPVEGIYSPLSYTVWSAATVVGHVDTPDAGGVSLNPMVFHTLNLLLHLASTWLVFQILLSLLERSTATSFLAAAIGAVVFAIHPLQVEPVAWISGLNNVLAGVLSLACIAAHLRAIKSDARFSRIWHAVSVIALLAALFSKPTAIVTPLIILAIDLLVLRLPLRRIAYPFAILIVTAIPFAIVARLSQPATGTFAPPLWQRLIIAGDTIGFYLCKLLLPWPLLIDYGRRPDAVLTNGGYEAYVIATVAAVCVAVGLWRRLPWVMGSLAVFIAGLALVLGLVPFDFQDFSTVADRYVYLPMLGVAIFVAFAVARLGRPAAIVAAVAIALLAVVSFRQAGLWSDNESIANHTLAVNDKSLAARMVLGYTAEHRGDLATAESHYRAGLAVFPDDGGLNRNFGNLLFKNGRSAEAIPYFQKAYSRSKYDPKLLNNLGSALLNTGHLNEAIEAFTIVTQKTPNHLNSHINLGIAYMNLGRLDDAAEYLRRAQRIDPNSPAVAKWMVQLQARRAGK